MSDQDVINEVRKMREDVARLANAVRSTATIIAQLTRHQLLFNTYVRLIGELAILNGAAMRGEPIDPEQSRHTVAELTRIGDLMGRESLDIRGATE